MAREGGHTWWRKFICLSEVGGPIEPRMWAHAWNFLVLFNNWKVLVLPPGEESPVSGPRMGIYDPSSRKQACRASGEWTKMTNDFCVTFYCPASHCISLCTAVFASVLIVLVPCEMKKPFSLPNKYGSAFNTFYLLNLKNLETSLKHFFIFLLCFRVWIEMKHLLGHEMQGGILSPRQDWSAF